MEQLRAAIIGCGNRGKSHARALKTETRCRVVALADIDPAATTAINTENEFSATEYTDYRAMLEKEQPDILAVCLWTPLHLPVLRDCLPFPSVKAILAEKPMAPTWGEYQEIARLAEETACQLTFCHQRRFGQGNQLARQLLNSGQFGEMKRMDLYCPRHLLDCGTHTFDQALSLNNESPLRWVLGAVDTSETFAYFEVKAEIMAAGHLVFENGVQATVQVGGPDKSMDSGVRVHGTKGFFEVNWDGHWGRAVVYDDPGWTPPVVEKDGMNEQMVGVVRNAVDCLLSGEEPELSYKRALRAGEIVFAFYESVRRRARVSLPLEGFTDNPLHSLLERGA